MYDYLGHVQKSKHTYISPLVQIPKRTRLGIAIRRDRRVIKANNGNAGRKIRLVRHAADIDDDGDRARRARPRRQRQRRLEPARLARRRDLDVDRRPAARGLYALLAVVRVVPVLVLLQQVEQLRPAAPQPLVARGDAPGRPARHDVRGAAVARVRRRRLGQREERVRHRGLLW